jgi:hypothetical protein
MPINRSTFLAQTSALILAAPFCINAQEKSHVTSEQVTHAVQELEKLAQKQIQENVVPGIAIAVVFQDKGVYAKGFGVRDVNTRQLIDADTVFQLASVSKSIGSTVDASPTRKRQVRRQANRGGKSAGRNASAEHADGFQPVHGAAQFLRIGVERELR